MLNAIARNVPWLVGGAADLTGSTSVGLTFEGAGVFSADDRGGRYLHFGVREHGMALRRERPLAVEAAPLRRRPT